VRSLQAEGYTHVYLTADPTAPYDRSQTGGQTLDDFYTVRGFENWGRGPLPLIQHPANTDPPPDAETIGVYIKSLVPDRSALDILLPLPEEQ
jgi:hypothetical protein